MKEFRVVTPEDLVRQNQEYAYTASLREINQTGESIHFGRDLAEINQLSSIPDSQRNIAENLRLKHLQTSMTQRVGNPDRVAVLVTRYGLTEELRQANQRDQKSS